MRLALIEGTVVAGVLRTMVARVLRTMATGVLCAMLGVLTLGGAVVKAQTLEEALAGAYTTNPVLQTERAKLRATDEELPQALANWRPNLSVSASAGRSRTEQTGYTHPIYQTPGTMSAQLVQPLYRGGRTVAQIEHAKARIQAGRARLVAQEQNTLLETASLYLNLLRDQASWELNTANVKVLTTQLEATRERFRVGEVTRTDVSEAEAALAGAVAAQVVAEGEVNSARASFVRITGVEPGGLESPPSFDDRLPRTLEEAQRIASTDNPTILAAQFDETASRYQIDITQGQLLPTVSLVASHGVYRNTQLFLKKTEKTEMTVQMSMPLYEGGAIYSQIRQAKQQNSGYRATVDSQRRATIETATQAYEELVSARARMVSIKSQIDANTIALEGTHQEASVGARTVLDVLNAEQSLLNSRVNLVQAQRDDLLAGYKLLSAIGRFSAQDLGLAVLPYDYEKNTQEVRGKWAGWSISEEAGE